MATSPFGHSFRFTPKKHHPLKLSLQGSRVGVKVLTSPLMREAPDRSQTNHLGIEGWEGLTSSHVFFAKERDVLPFLKIDEELVAVEASSRRRGGRLVGYGQKRERGWAPHAVRPRSSWLLWAEGKENHSCLPWPLLTPPGVPDRGSPIVNH